jgi:hypothetical protein
MAWDANIELSRFVLGTKYLPLPIKQMKAASAPLRLLTMLCTSHDEAAADGRANCGAQPNRRALLVSPGFQFGLILKPRGARCRKQSWCLCRESRVPSDNMDTTERTSMRSAAALQLPRFRCHCGRFVLWSDNDRSTRATPSLRPRRACVTPSALRESQMVSPDSLGVWQWGQSRSALTSTCATAVWPDALQ